MSEGKVVISWRKDADGCHYTRTDFTGDKLSHWEAQGLLMGIVMGNHNVCAQVEGDNDGTTDNNYADESASDRG